MKKTCFMALVSLSFLSACATRPSSITATSVPIERYSNNNCDSLSVEMQSEKKKLVKLSELQNGKATGDAIGVFLLGIPFSKLDGDHESEIAEVKGRVIAIEAMQTKNKCKKASS